MNVLVFGGRSPISVGLCKKLVNSGNQVHLATRNIDAQLEEISKDIQIFRLYEIDLANTDLAVKLTAKIDQEERRRGDVRRRERLAGTGRWSVLFSKRSDVANAGPFPRRP